jgi:hypothetical protein
MRLHENAPENKGREFGNGKEPLLVALLAAGPFLLLGAFVLLDRLLR